MKTFSQFLMESLTISVSMKAFKSLSYEAKSLIEDWESFDFKANGGLERSIKANDAAAKEIYQAMEPVRKTIRGGKIKLYRGLTKGSKHTYWQGRTIESWTDNKYVAEYFAELRTSQTKDGKSRLSEIYTKQQIDKFVDQYEKTGFVTVGKKKYVRNKQSPEYYNIYSGNQFVTDGDDLRDELETDNEDRKRKNKELLDSAILQEKVFDVKDIIWITNNLNSKEYIVKVK